MTTFASTPVSKNQSLGMPGVRSSRNLLAPPTLIRAGNPDLLLSGGDPEVKSFPMVPHTCLYMAQKPGNNVAMEEFNRDSGTFCILLHLYELFIGGSMENKTLAGEEFSKPLKPVMLAPEWRQDNDSELSKETKRLEEVYSMELDPKDVEKTAKFATTR